MKTGLALGWWVQTYHDPRRPSHGRHSSAFGQGTQDVFDNVSNGQSCAESIDSAVVGSRALVSGDYGGNHPFQHAVSAMMKARSSNGSKGKEAVLACRLWKRRRR